MFQTAKSMFPHRASRREFGDVHFRLERLEARVLCDASPALTPAQLVSQGNNEFAFRLLQQLDKTNAGNLFYSPYSADTAMEMALQGAKGQTATQILQALDLPSKDVALAGIAALYQLFQSDPTTAGYTLSTANRIWVSENFPLLESFIDGSLQDFGAAPQTVDFSDPNTAAATINAWVSAQTNGKIPDLISPGDITSFTQLILTNAIYFKDNWADPFNAANTTNQPFQSKSTEAATVSMMQETSEFGYYAQSGPDGFQAVDLPFEGDLSMVVILPTTYNLTAFESSLTGSLFSQITSDFTPSLVDVQLPKFGLSGTYDLVVPLENLGIKNAFGAGADFSGISPDKLKISDVIQKSYISVNENGTEAAAATVVILGATVVVANPLPPPNRILFNADHPFLFAIRDDATNSILFMGNVTDPSNGAADYDTPPTSVPGKPSDPTSFPIKVAPPASPVITTATPTATPPPVAAAKSPPPANNVTDTPPAHESPSLASSSADSDLLETPVSPILSAIDLLFA